jgi:aquaporin Z
MNYLETEKPYVHRRFDDFLYPLAPFIVELIGTTMLVFTVGCSSLTQSQSPSTKEFSALSIGFSLIVLVFLGGHISGGHYNPAVTTGILFTMRSKISPSKAIGYILVQLIGSILGSCLVYVCTGGGLFGPQVGSGYSIANGIASEIIATFLLVSVVLNVATTQAQENNSFFGLAIGLTVTCMAIAVGGISGGAFNPAVGTGPHILRWLVNGSGYTSFWIYWIGPLIGAAVAALLFRITNVPEYVDKMKDSIPTVPNTQLDMLDKDQSSYYRAIQSRHLVRPESVELQTTDLSYLQPSINNE